MVWSVVNCRLELQGNSELHLSRHSVPDAGICLESVVFDWPTHMPMRPNLACFSPTHGPCQVVRLTASNFACMAAMPCCIRKKLGILPQNANCRPHTGKLGAHCLHSTYNLPRVLDCPKYILETQGSQSCGSQHNQKLKNEKHALTI